MLRKQCAMLLFQPMGLFILFRKIFQQISVRIPHLPKPALIFMFSYIETADRRLAELDNNSRNGGNSSYCWHSAYLINKRHGHDDEHNKRNQEKNV